MHASAELQQQQQESQARLAQLQQAATQQLQEAENSSQDKMEGYCTNFRSHPTALLTRYASGWQGNASGASGGFAPSMGLRLLL